MSNIHKYFLNNSETVIHKWIHYFDIYERHLSRFINKSPTIIEIGVGGGGSLAMWANYFGTGSKIIGIDTNPDCKKYEKENIEIFIGSQDCKNITDSIFQKYPKIDIVIDDGSHIMNHMISSFKILYEKISVNGVYIVEDTHTCYWHEFGGGLKKEESFIEFAKNKIDEINAVHSRGAVPVTHFTKHTDQISFYDSVVVFEKRKQARRQAPMTQEM